MKDLATKNGSITKKAAIQSAVFSPIRFLNRAGKRIIRDPIIVNGNRIQIRFSPKIEFVPKIKSCNKNGGGYGAEPA